MDTLAFSLRVTAPDPEVARVSIGRRQFSIGRPLEFDEASPHVAAIEYALGAVGGEVVNGLREFARQLREGIYIITPDEFILDANPALVRMLGYDSKEELLQRKLSDVLPVTIQYGKAHQLADERGTHLSHDHGRLSFRIRTG